MTTALTLWRPQPDQIYCMDALTFLGTLPEESVNCCVTSPPYFGLRDYGAPGQIGLEDSPQAFVAALVEVFREVRRVLRSDGVAWLNLGDSYGTGTTSPRQQGKRGLGVNTQAAQDAVPRIGGQAKQLLGIPWRVALALQADGWWIRSAAPWIKGSAMPESVTDRSTTAHEYVFQLTKAEHYWFDADAVRKPALFVDDRRAGRGRFTYNGKHDGSQTQQAFVSIDPAGRNRRTSDTFYDAMDAQIAHWQHVRANGGALIEGDTIAALLVNPAGYDGAHFATFPPKLIEPCILAGCPKQVCSVCGAPWERVTTKQTSFEGGSGKAGRTAEQVNGSGKWAGKQYGTNLKLGPVVSVETLGFRPTCTCDADTRPGLVLDPFMGAGTTALVAMQHGRSYIGSELNPEYVQLARRRLMTDIERLNEDAASATYDDLPLFADLEKPT